MEGKSTTTRVAPDNGSGALPRQILWQEMRILGYVSTNMENPGRVAYIQTGWGRFMEWKYPVSVEITNSAAFKGVGAVEAAASL